MDEYRISEAARKTGFSESALRYYEREGVVVPDRTPSGYRSYDDGAIMSLQFVRRAKRLGLKLAEITELLELLAGDECAPVQKRLSALVDEQIETAQDKIAELMAFVRDLQRVRADLSWHQPHGGPCDAACGCAVEDARPDQAMPVALVTGAADTTDTLCKLPSVEMTQRRADWRRWAYQIRGREDIDGGVRVFFSRAANVSELTALALAEQDCCRFFEFDVGITSSGVSLDVRAPPEAQDTIRAIFGEPAPAISRRAATSTSRA